MTKYHLTNHFNYFFKRLNPSITFTQIASSEHANITSLIENKNGLASSLSPICFLQGSYKHATAIYSINDVDIIVLCRLLQYPGNEFGVQWTRDQIFDTIAAPLKHDGRYSGKVRYNKGSMCIKVKLGIKIEILPVVFKAVNTDPNIEPFSLYRPDKRQWEDGYARYHQGYLTAKNQPEYTNGNFIPAIKVLKHLRSKFNQNAVSFHIECLLYSLPNNLFIGQPVEYIANMIRYISSTTTLKWWREREVRTPCGERRVFTDSEWNLKNWASFHKSLCLWAKIANAANQATNKERAITLWQLLLGKDFFPKEAS